MTLYGLGTVLAFGGGAIMVGSQIWAMVFLRKHAKRGLGASMLQPEHEVHAAVRPVRRLAWWGMAITGAGILLVALSGAGT